MDALPLVWYRMLLAVGFVGLYVLIKRFSLSAPKNALFGFTVAGLVIAVHWIAFFQAIKVSNVSVTLATMSTGSFFAAILEPFWYKRKIIWYEILFGVLVIAGLGIIFKVEAKYVDGILLALFSAFLSAVFSLINGKYTHYYRPSVISFYELLSGVGFITLYLAFTGGFSASFFKVTLNDWMYLLLLASICTGYAFIASVKVMRFISPYTVMLTINLEPVYGILLAFFILGDAEKMSPQFYLGALVILFTVIANGILKARQKKVKALH